MRARISIGFTRSLILLEPGEALEALKAELSYTNRAMSYSLFKFKKGMRVAERRIYDKHGEIPDWYREFQRNKLAELEAKTYVKCWEPHEEGISTFTGLVDTAKAFLEKKGFTVEVADLREVPTNKKTFPKQNLRLREPQAVVLDKVQKGDWGVVKGWGLISLPTGTGKTLSAQTIIDFLGHKTLFLVPSRPILNQVVRRFAKAFGPENVAMYGDGKKDRAWITVGTYQSVARAEDGAFDDVDVLVSDEVHHVPSETFFQSRMKVRNAFYSLGLTATNSRQDGATMMIEAGCGPVLYDYPITKAIDAGYLARPTFVIYEVETTGGTFERFKTSKQKGKQVRKSMGMEIAKPYNESDLGEAYSHWMVGNDQLNEFIAAMSRDEAANGGSTLLLIDEIKHGDRLQGLLPEAGYATGGDKGNERLLDDFNAKRVPILIASSVLNEGADTIPVTLLWDLVGGVSPGQQLQRVGRALRNDEDENGVPRKTKVVVCDIDFVNCKILHKHTLVREKALAKIGQVVRVKLF